MLTITTAHTPGWHQASLDGQTDRLMDGWIDLCNILWLWTLCVFLRPVFVKRGWMGGGGVVPGGETSGHLHSMQGQLWPLQGLYTHCV